MAGAAAEAVGGRRCPGGAVQRGVRALLHGLGRPHHPGKALHQRGQVASPPTHASCAPADVHLGSSGQALCHHSSPPHSPAAPHRQQVRGQAAVAPCPRPSPWPSRRPAGMARPQMQQDARDKLEALLQRQQAQRDEGEAKVRADALCHDRAAAPDSCSDKHNPLPSLPPCRPWAPSAARPCAGACSCSSCARWRGRWPTNATTPRRSRWAPVRV